MLDVKRFVEQPDLLPSPESSPVETLVDRYVLGQAVALARAGNHAQAERLLSALVRRPQPPPAALDLLARIYAQTGHFDEAAGLWQRAAELDPGNEGYAAGLRRIAKIKDQPRWRRLVRPALLTIAPALLMVVCMAALLLISRWAGFGDAGSTATAVPGLVQVSWLEETPQAAGETVIVPSITPSATPSPVTSPGVAPVDTDATATYAAQQAILAEGQAAAYETQVADLTATIAAQSTIIATLQVRLPPDTPMPTGTATSTPTLAITHTFTPNPTLTPTLTPIVTETIPVTPTPDGPFDDPRPGSLYRVREGDTLMDIARRAYGNAFEYERIKIANGIQSNQNLIRTGDILYIPPLP